MPSALAEAPGPGIPPRANSRSASSPVPANALHRPTQQIPPPPRPPLGHETWPASPATGPGSPAPTACSTTARVHRGANGRRASSASPWQTGKNALRITRWLSQFTPLDVAHPLQGTLLRGLGCVELDTVWLERHGPPLARREFDFHGMFSPRTDFIVTRSDRNSEPPRRPDIPSYETARTRCGNRELFRQWSARRTSAGDDMDGHRSTQGGRRRATSYDNQPERKGN
jgi:hypothetical protein